MTETEYYENNEKCFNDAYENTYVIVTGKQSFEELLESRDCDLYFIDDPSNDLSVELIDDLVEHFIRTEEYEKCQELVDLKKEL